MRISKLCYWLACVGLLHCGAVAMADEYDDAMDQKYPVPTYISKCFENSSSTADMRECNQLEAAYWDNMLNENYKAALKSCDNFARNYFEGEEQAEFATKCKTNLKNAQLGWIKYRDAMSSVQCDLNPEHGGTMQLLICDSAYIRIVRAQAIALGELYDGN